MRTTAAELEAAAVEAFRAALDAVELPVVGAAPADLVIAGPAGPVAVQITAAALADSARVLKLLHGERRPHGDVDALNVLVADRVTDDARDLLRQAGWGYLDRRGRLWLRTTGIHVNDTDLPALPREGGRVADGDPITGRTGLAVAVHLLADPAARPSIRQLAERTDSSRSAVHQAVTRLRDRALVEADLTPLVPDLFAAAAEVWQPVRHPFVGPVDAPSDRWLLSGDLAAARLGAPLVTNADGPVAVYGPAEAVRRLHRRWGDDPAGANTMATVPFPLPAAGRHVAGWQLAHPVVVALDLAQDRSRGREILDDWSPEGFARVW